MKNLLFLFLIVSSFFYLSTKKAQADEGIKTVKVDGQLIYYERPTSDTKGAIFSFNMEAFHNVYYLDCPTRKFIWLMQWDIAKKQETGAHEGAGWKPLNDKSKRANAVFDAICIGSTVDSPWLQRDVRADLPEKNNSQAFEALLDTIHLVGVTLVIDKEDKTIGCQIERTIAYFDRRRIEMVFCKRLFEGKEDVENVVKHETAHVLQWCQGGKVPGGRLATLLSKPSIAGASYAIHNEYRGRQYEIEADAESFANTTSLLGAKKALENTCLGR